VQVTTEAERHIFSVEVYLSDLDPNAVRVELYADGGNGGPPVLQEMARIRQLAGASGGYVFSAAVPAARPQTDYTPRIISHCDGVAIPLEDARILWQR
jgi:starch phosphorylase